MSERRAISEIVGDGAGEGGARCVVYRALRELLCEACGSVISEGELFTRRRIQGQRLRVMPRCGKCAPFKLEATERRSALLDTLLESDPTTKPTPTVAEREHVAEAVRRRLGPALSRGKRQAS
ncbi:MAG TPA: hypothetical protein VEQ42_04565 [Pyrinomonadaceae bacterium]|nr:hypothetical protein [Pyrinomonadaceae bacterium]